jgi:hypothetical protein
MSGTLSKETTIAYENARKEMMASAEKWKIVFAQIIEVRFDNPVSTIILDLVIITSNERSHQDLTRIF